MCSAFHGFPTQVNRKCNPEEKTKATQIWPLPLHIKGLLVFSSGIHIPLTKNLSFIRCMYICT